MESMFSWQPLLSLAGSITLVYPMEHVYAEERKKPVLGAGYFFLCWFHCYFCLFFNVKEQFSGDF